MSRAQRHIEQYRQGDALLQVVDPHGRTCSGLPVSVEQESHRFQFGCVTSDLSGVYDDDRTRYDRRLREVFNVVRREKGELPVEANVLNVDLSGVSQHMHLARVQRELDRLDEQAARPRSAMPDVQVFVSGRTLGWCLDQRPLGIHTFDEEKAAQSLARLYTLCFAHPRVRGLFWCGLSDRERGVDGGGLLQENISPKHAHRALRKLIHVIWHSRDRGRTDALGRFRFRGFYGTYRVVVAAYGVTPVIRKFDLHPEHQKESIVVPGGSFNADA